MRKPLFPLLKVTSLAFGMILLFNGLLIAGDFTCFGYKSSTDHFSCGQHGNCVWWAAYNRPDLAKKIVGSGWNGGQWSSRFEKMGFAVDLDPQPGDIVEFSSPGHVAYVTRVNDDGSFNVSEMDWYGSQGFVDGVNRSTYYPAGDGNYHRNGGSMNWSIRGFIHPAYPPVLTLRKVGDVAWAPTNRSCINAKRWYRITGGELVQSLTKNACYSIDYQAEGVSRDVIFGDFGLYSCTQ